MNTHKSIPILIAALGSVGFIAIVLTANKQPPAPTQIAAPTVSQQQTLVRKARYTRTVPEEKVQVFEANILNSDDNQLVIEFCYPDVPGLCRRLSFDANAGTLTDVATEGAQTFAPVTTKASLRLSKKADGKVYLEGDAIFDENTYPNLWVIEEI